jgi:hypothetical protein
VYQSKPASDTCKFICHRLEQLVASLLSASLHSCSTVGRKGETRCLPGSSGAVVSHSSLFAGSRKIIGVADLGGNEDMDPQPAMCQPDMLQSSTTLGLYSQLPAASFPGREFSVWLSSFSHAEPAVCLRLFCESTLWRPSPRARTA